MNQKQPVLNEKVLVTGTTSDYIDWIRKALPGQALFLTSPDIRNRAKEDCPSRDEEILSPMEDISEVKRALDTHLKKWNQRLVGITCFDCEYMELTSMLASDSGLNYPDINGIQNCRDKLVSKKIWQENSIPCPRAVPVNSLEEITEFLQLTRAGIVLKPFCGSGSELVFRCRTEKQCEQGFMEIKTGLEERASRPLFKNNSSCEYLMLAEEMMEGPEFSCDFITQNNEITIIRITRKIKAPVGPFGTIMGYVLPSALPCQVDYPKFKQMLKKSADVLGINRGICMVDFIISNDEPILIEMTPRPGGDCLPPLILEAGNLDIISLAVEFAREKTLLSNNTLTPEGGYGKGREKDKKELVPKEDFSFKPHVGLRIHAHKNGILKKIDTDQLKDEKRIKKINFIRKPGHIITMPPRDYDSWLLGHIIMEADPDKDPETQCLTTVRHLIVEIE